MAAADLSLSLEEVARVVSYDPDTGAFYWCEAKGRRRVGGRADVAHRKGYRRLFLFGKRRLAHRIAWLLTTGRWPVHCIDHINRDPSDNRIANLRDVPQRLNSYNARRPVNNTSGFKGVSPRRGKWRAVFYVDNRQIYLGLFTDAEDAANAYLAKAAELGVLA